MINGFDAVPSGFGVTMDGDPTVSEDAAASLASFVACIVLS